MSDEDEGSRGEGRRESSLIASALDSQPLCGETFRLRTPLLETRFCWFEGSTPVAMENPTAPIK